MAKTDFTNEFSKISAEFTKGQKKIGEHDLLLRQIIIPFLILFLGLVVVDLFLDHSHHSRMDSIQTRITELEKDVATYRTEKQEIIDCFKYSKYWEYNKCFNN